jgi:hypothetical protein
VNRLFGSKEKQELVISSSDLDAALKHLNSMPFTVTQIMPEKWGIQQVKTWLLEDIPKRIKVDDCFDFGTGLWGHVKPLGYEFSNYPNDEHRLQILISIRSVKTNLNDLTTLIRI